MGWEIVQVGIYHYPTIHPTRPRRVAKRLQQSRRRKSDERSQNWRVRATTGCSTGRRRGADLFGRQFYEAGFGIERDLLKQAEESMSSK